MSLSTEEREVPLSNSYEKIHLLNKESIQKHKQKYNHIDIGLVQVGVKPLSKEGLNTSILLVLQDSRLLNYDESILGTVETSLYKGPIHFDCYPNFSVSLKDKNILRALTLQIKTHNYKVADGSIPLALVYRIHYKAMSSAFGENAFKHSPRGETLLLQTDISRANTTIPRSINWNQVTLLEQWELENQIPQQVVQNISPTNVIQHPEGRVTIRFPRRSVNSRSSPSFHISYTRSIELNPNLPPIITIPPSTHRSTPPPSMHRDTPTRDTIPLPPSTDRSNHEILLELEISSLDNRSGISRLVYQQNQPEPILENIGFPHHSPTYSQMIDVELNILEKHFEPNKVFLNKEFNSKNNRQIKEWFFKTFVDKTKDLKQKYYDYGCIWKLLWKGL